jgi:hypothetical protein
MIDTGYGGAIDINKVSPMASFAAEAFNTTNGVSGKYFISFFSAIKLLDSDVVTINFPKEATLMPTSGTSLDCTAVSGVKSLTCSKGKTDSELIVSMTSLAYNTGLFKFSILNIRNPSSLK